MKKQKKQFILMLLILAILGVGYVLLQKYNKEQELAGTEEATEALLVKNGSKVTAAQITELTYFCGEEECSLIKVEDFWKAKENQELSLKQSTINTMVSGIISTNVVSRLEAVEDLAEYGLAEPTNVITIMVEGEAHTIKIGDKNPVTSYLYVMLDGDSTIFVVTNSMGNSFNHGMDDLVEEAEETTTEG